MKKTSKPADHEAQILVVDDHPVIRNGVYGLLAQNSRWRVCAEAENGREAVEKVRALKPDLVILDISMPVMNGVEAAREIRRIAPATKILILSMHTGAQVETEARNAGADAILSKTNAAASLIQAVERLVNATSESEPYQRSIAESADSFQ